MVRIAIECGSNESCFLGQHVCSKCCCCYCCCSQQQHNQQQQNQNQQQRIISQVSPKERNKQQYYFWRTITTTSTTTASMIRLIMMICIIGTLLFFPMVKKTFDNDMIIISNNNHNTNDYYKILEFEWNPFIKRQQRQQQQQQQQQENGSNSTTIFPYKTTNNYNHNNNNNPTTSNNHKPTLFLHVGPMKTGTTSIQSMLTKQQLIVQPLETYDRIKIISNFDYIPMNRLLENCFLMSKKKTTSTQTQNNDNNNVTDCSEWDRLLHLFYQHYHYQQHDSISSSSSSSSQQQQYYNTTNTPTTTLTPTNNINMNMNFNIVHSVELYSKFPYTTKAISMLRNLTNDWNVQIILYYRKPYHWYPSAYHQYRKFFIYKSRGGRYIDFDYTTKQKQEKQKQQQQQQERLLLATNNENNDTIIHNTLSIMTFPEFLQQRQSVLADSLRTFEYFTHVFGSNHVTMLPFDYATTTTTNTTTTTTTTSTTSSIEIDFICHGLKANYTCQHLINSNHYNPNPNNNNNNSPRHRRTRIRANEKKFFINEDYLALVAFENGFLDHAIAKKRNEIMMKNTTTTTKQKQKSKQKIWNARKEIVDLLHEKYFLQKEQFSSFPQLCISTQQQEWLWNRTIVSEQVFHQHYQQQKQQQVLLQQEHEQYFDELKKNFQKESYKWCTIDAVTMLQNKTWQERLHSIFD